MPTTVPSPVMAPPSPSHNPPSNNSRLSRLKETIRAATRMTSSPSTPTTPPRQHPLPPSSFHPKSKPSLDTRASEESHRSSPDSETPSRPGSRLGFAVKAFRRSSLDLLPTTPPRKEERQRDREERDRLAKEEKERKAKEKAEKAAAKAAASSSKRSPKSPISKEKQQQVKDTLKKDKTYLWKPAFQHPTLSKGSMSSPTLDLLANTEEASTSTTNVNDISGPSQLVPVRARRPSGPPTPSPLTPKLKPATPLRIRTSASASATHLPLVQSSSSSSPPRPTRERNSPPSPSPMRRRVTSPMEGNGLTKLPNSSSSSLITPASPTRPTRSTSQGGIARMANVSSSSLVQPNSPSRIATRAASPPLSPTRTRPLSPSTPTRPRALSPTNNGSPTSPIRRPLRDLLRNAIVALLRALNHPPHPYAASSSSARHWDEVEARLRALIKLEQRGWAGDGDRAEERERKTFVESIGDGYLLCLLINLFLPGNVAPLKPSHNPQSTTNVPKFLKALQTHFQGNTNEGEVHVPAFLVDDLQYSTTNLEGLERVGKCVVALANLSEKNEAGGARGVYGGKASISTPNLGQIRSVSPISAGGGARNWGGVVLDTVKSEDETSRHPTEKISTALQSSPPIAVPLAPSPSIQGDRMSVSTTGTSATYLSSLFQSPRMSTAAAEPGVGLEGGGTIRTIMTTTEATSAPSMSDDYYADPPDRDRRRSGELKRPRRQSVELTRVEEETGSGGETVKKRPANIYVPPPPIPATSAPNASGSPKTPIMLGKGRWPEDFLDVFGPGSRGVGMEPDDGLVEKTVKQQQGKESQESQEQEATPNKGSIPIEEGPDVLSTSAPNSPTPSVLLQSKEPRRQLRVRRTSSGTSSATPIPIATTPLSSSPSRPGLVSRTQSSPPRNSKMPASSSPPRIRPIPTSSSPPGLLPKPTPSTPEKASCPPTNQMLRRHSSNARVERSQSPRRPSRDVMNGSAIDDTMDNMAEVMGATTAVVPFPRRSSNEYSRRPSGEHRRTSGENRRASAEHPRQREGLSVLPTLPSSSEQLSSQAQPSPKGKEKEQVIPSRPPLSRGRFQSEVATSAASSRIKPRPSSFDEYVAVQNGLNGMPPRGRTESLVNLGGSEQNLVGSMIRDRGASVMNSGMRKILIVREDGKPATHYQLGNCIGRGQFGSVYRALNLNTGQTVAVKRITLAGLSDPEITQLMNEVELLKRLSHPSIVKYEGMSRDSDTLNIVLEYVENGSLLHTIKAFGRLNEKLVASYVIKILEGLYYLHQSQVVHCDLKAANILTTKNGNVKLSDFGVSLNLRAMENIKSDVAGTPNWMAPEVIELKGASTASDIWSLGCTVVELLTGKPPYADIHNGMTVLFRIVDDEMPPIPDNCSESLRDFLTQCFQKDPTRRPSAEVLFEHEWLAQAWGLNKDLRQQDSIPFLKRVSAELHRADITRQLSGIDLTHADTPVTETVQHRDEQFKMPLPKRSSGTPSEIAPGHEGELRQHHAFVKTSFSKSVICRVCQIPVKTRAVLCQDCSLIAHSRCAADAPATCDIRTQLLLYAQLTHEHVPPPPSPAAEITPSSSPPTHVDSPLATSPSGPFKIFSRKKSRQSYAETESSAPSTAPVPPPEDDGRRKNMFFGRGRASDDRSRSRASLITSSTPNSASLRSAGDKLEHASSSQGTRQLPISTPEPKPKPKKHESDVNRVASPSFEATNTSLDRPLSPDDPSYARRRRRLSKVESQTSSKNGCLVQ